MKIIEQGIDTTEIPMNELIEYCVNDVEITHQLYEKSI